MCGRYSLETRSHELVEAFSLGASFAWGPRYNIAPTQPVPIVRPAESGGLRCDVVRWGLSPAWAGRLLINARSETAASKRSFQDSFATRRCLVPATGFFEWQKLGGARQPFHIRLADRSLFAFAGIWDRTHIDGENMNAFVILTTRPNSVMRPIHDRMPVILRPDAWQTWLGPGGDRKPDLLEPVADSDLQACPVSSMVNSAANDDPACVAPLAPGEAADPGTDGESLWDL